MRTQKSLYDKDFYKWSHEQAMLLKKHEFLKADLENIIEEIECLGRSERSALKSHFIILLIHLLKQQLQPTKATYSWTYSIDNSRIEIEDILKDNPSLKRKIPEILKEAHNTAVRKASRETGIEERNFPQECPWTIKEVLGE